jgi:hypothetical protein
MAMQCWDPQVSAGFGSEQGEVRRGEAWNGLSGTGTAMHGSELGKDRTGAVWRRTEGQGLDRHGDLGKS